LSSGWYYLLNDTRIGPVEGSEIERLVSQGSVTAHTPVWCDGLDGWEEAGNHFSISEGFSGPPPVPPRSPSARRATSESSGGHGAIVGSIGLYHGASARSFGEAISVCFNKYVTFSGRASRSEYWYFFLFCILLGLATAVVDMVIFGVANELSPVNALTSLALFLPSLAVAVRRLHDTNRSGWWIGGFWPGLLGFAVVIGMIAAANPYAGDAIGGLFAVLGIVFLVYSIALLVFLCQRGNPGQNRFG